MKAILISLDTNCADHLGCYGYRFETSPNIDKFASEGVTFERCYASDVPTPPSYTAMFSGRFGIHNGIFGFQPPETYRPGPPLLQEVLVGAGYRTGAISNLFYPCPWLFRGWRDVTFPGTGFQRGPAPEVTDEAIAWLNNHSQEDFFLFVHYWEPHQPYKKAPEKHRKLFPTESYDDFAPSMDFINSNPIMKDFYYRYHEMGEGDGDLSPSEVLARYDSQIHFADEEVGRLFGYLDEKGLADETLVIVTSDHGEAFGEYCFFDHFSCYDNISHVPLIARLPGKFPKGKRVDGFVYGADLMPTILSHAGLDVPDGIDGEDLLPSVLEDEPTPHPFAVTDTNALVGQRMIVEGKWAMAHTLNAGPFLHIKPYELFDLEGDPEEDLAPEHPDMVKDLRIKMEDWLDEQLDGGPDPLAYAARDGGWALGHLSLIHGVLSNLEFAMQNKIFWETFKRKHGPGIMYLPRLKALK